MSKKLLKGSIATQEGGTLVKVSEPNETLAHAEVDTEGRVDQKAIQTEKYQWSLIKGTYITNVSDTFEHLTPGYYSLGYSQEIGMYFVKEDVNLDRLYRMPNQATDIIMDDISKFWTLRDTYKKYHQVFKRNYLLYSAPGTGKTSLINLMCQDLIKLYNGIVFNLTCERDIESFPDAVRRVRKTDGDVKIIAIIEDIDNFIGSEHSRSALDTQLLNILDGNFKMSDVVIIATTNYIERLQSRYKNRPSRFNKVVEFPLPNAESRRLYLEKTVFKEDLEKINLDLWVEKTDGYTIDHIKELTLLFFVFGTSEEEAFETVGSMVRKNNKLTNNTSVNGSKMGF